MCKSRGATLFSALLVGTPRFRPFRKRGIRVPLSSHPERSERAPPNLGPALISTSREVDEGTPR